MENNTFNHLPASLLAEINFETYSSTCIRNNNQQPGQRAVRWRSKVVPGLERTLIACQCGCGRTYDELGNWSTALQGPQPDLSSIFQCPTGSCRTPPQRHGNKEKNHRELSNLTRPGGRKILGRGASPQQTVFPVNWRSALEEPIFQCPNGCCITPPQPQDNTAQIPGGTSNLILPGGRCIPGRGTYYPAQQPVYPGTVEPVFYQYTSGINVMGQVYANWQSQSSKPRRYKK